MGTRSVLGGTHLAIGVCVALWGCGDAGMPAPARVPTSAADAGARTAASTGLDGSGAAPTQATGPQAAPSTDPAPTFVQVYREVIAGDGCAQAFCHGAGVGTLHLSVRQTEAYAALVGVPAQGIDSDPSCASTGLQRVEPFQPERSLLYLKVAGKPPCGERMPPGAMRALPAEHVELLRRWIEGGALQGDTPAPREPAPAAPVRPTAPAAGVSDWASFGYDLGNTRYKRDETKLSPANVARLQPLWKIDVEGGTNGTPTVVGGVLYYGDYANVLHALDAATGDQVWEAAVPSFEINSSPLVTSDRVYVAAGASLTAYERATGQQLWQTQVTPEDNAWIVSSPALAGDSIVFGVCGSEASVNKTDFTFDGSVVAVDRRSGAIKWQLMVAGSAQQAGDGVPVWSSAAIDEQRKLAFIGTGQSYEAPASPLSDALLAIHYDTGELAWAHQYTVDDVYTLYGAASQGPDLDIGASPNLFVSQGRDAVGVGSKAGIYKALDRESGEVLWQRDMLTPGGVEGGVIASAAVGDGVVYVTSNDWKVYSFTSTGEHSEQDTAVTFALDADSGETLWQTRVHTPAVGFLTLANGVLYQGLLDGTGMALDAQSGEMLWETNLEHDLACGFSVVDGVLYGGSGGTWITRSTRPGGSMFAFSAGKD